MATHYLCAGERINQAVGILSSPEKIEGLLFYGTDIDNDGKMDVYDAGIKDGYVASWKEDGKEHWLLVRKKYDGLFLYEEYPRGSTPILSR